MASDDEVQAYFKMSLKYLEAAHLCLTNGLREPAMANGLHALELAMKAALFSDGRFNLKTHYVGGIFGKHFLTRIGAERYGKLNSLLTKYNLPRYPGDEEVDYDDVAEDLVFIDAMVREDVHHLLNELTGNDGSK